MCKLAVCPNIARRIHEQCSTKSMEIYHDLGQTQRTKNHSACTKATCFANDLQSSNILPGHTRPGCSCPLLGADPRQLQKTLELHGAALLRLNERDEKVEIQVEPMVKDMKYFAISHALADGLCNTERNALPQCQLRRIIRCIKSAMTAQRLSQDCPVYIWIDIMCLPLRSSPFHGVTTHTFNTLQRVMRYAIAVVVLDTDIALLSRNSSYTERFLRISFSSWGSRLWTLFEATMAQKVLFECKDGVMELKDFLEPSTDVGTTKDAANRGPSRYARLKKSGKHPKGDRLLGLLRRALHCGRASVESDSALLKDEIKYWLEFPPIESHTVNSHTNNPHMNNSDTNNFHSIDSHTYGIQHRL